MSETPQWMIVNGRDYLVEARRRVELLPDGPIGAIYILFEPGDGTSYAVFAHRHYRRCWSTALMSPLPATASGRLAYYDVRVGEWELEHELGITSRCTRAAYGALLLALDEAAG